MPGLGRTAQEALLNVAILAVLATPLSLPPAYALAVATLLLLGLWFGARMCLRSGIGLPMPLRLWAVTVVFMGAAWAMHMFDAQGKLMLHSLGLDRVSKYALMLFILPALAALPIRRKALLWGCVLGAASAAALALWQVGLQGYERAAGHTNAIQFGNLGLLLGIWCAVWARQAPGRGERALAWSGALSGLVASLASGSRGGWLALPLLLWLVLWLAPDPARAQPRMGRIGATTVALCLALVLLPPVQQRLELAVQEYSGHRLDAQPTAVGLRLSLWPFAQKLVQQHPLLGFGQSGYEVQQQQAVQRGELPAQALELNHAHNEWLDMAAKRGLLGTFALVLFYGVPGLLFWRCLAHAPGPAGALQRAAAVCGLATVAGFLIFGMTQVMFAHNNGNMTYLLAVSLWLAACCKGVHTAPTGGWQQNKVEITA